MKPHDFEEFEESPVIGYLVHQDGRVYSQRSGKLLKPFRTGIGYLQVNLARETWYLAHLVYATFRGVRPKRIKFLDGNRENCALENIHNPSGDFAEIPMED